MSAPAGRISAGGVLAGYAGDSGRDVGDPMGSSAAAPEDGPELISVESFVNLFSARASTSPTSSPSTPSFISSCI